jgi:hypothetical protein
MKLRAKPRRPAEEEPRLWSTIAADGAGGASHVEHVAGPGLAAIPRRQLAQVQLKLFPDWPDDRRGVEIVG